VNAPANNTALLERLPQVRGRYRADVPLADQTWFRVGGAAQVVFKPEDAQDLAHFLRHKPADVPVTVLGAASNVIIRDGGIDGVLIRLGRGFAQLSLDARSGNLTAGAANLDVNVAQYAMQQGRGGLAFLCGIPGAIGGALRMNAGAYGSEIKDVLHEAELVTPSGEMKRISAAEMGFAYRHCSLPTDVIFTAAIFRTQPQDASEIAEQMRAIQEARSATQPIRARTGGSSFRNPEGAKAWELIDAAGLRATIRGGAMVSEKHCNFLINTGSARAADLEQLMQHIIARVKEHSGIELEPEIQFLGKPLSY
jgi:UDP-N-acetylmuramate dehydrogenase